MSVEVEEALGTVVQMRAKFRVVTCLLVEEALGTVVQIRAKFRVVTCLLKYRNPLGQLYKLEPSFVLLPVC